MNHLRICSTMLIVFLFVFVLKGQNDTVPNFFEIKARWEEKLSSLAGIENEEGMTDEEMEDGELANFNRWVAMWRYRLGPNGEMTTANEVMNELQNSGLLNHNTRSSMNCDPLEDDNILWTNLGPLNSQGSLGLAGGANHCSNRVPQKQNQGRVESISVNPTNPDDILIGAYNGGIWLWSNTTASWNNTTDDEGYSLYGMNNLVRHPANAKIVYATTFGQGNSFSAFSRAYGMGIIMSADGGDSWQKTGLTYPNYNYWNSTFVKLEIDPNSTLTNTILYAYSDTDLWKWQGDQFANGTWNLIPIDGTWYDGNLWWSYVNKEGDMECGPNGDVWFSNYYGLYKIPNGSVTATLVNNYSIPPNFVNQPSCGISAQSLRQDIMIEINQQGHIVFFCKFTKCPVIGMPTTAKYFYKSTDNGNTWSSVPTSVNGHPPQQFVVNPVNSDMIYAENANRCMYKYTFDYGLQTESSTSMGNGENHVDVRTLLVYSGNQADGTDNVLYVGTDGGISKTINGDDWVDITGQGLSITNYYGVGITETNDKMILAGAQDGSVNYYINGSFFETLPAADNGDCLINSPGDIIVLQESTSGGSNDGNLHRGNLVGSSFTQTNSNSVGGFVNPLCWNPGSVNNEFFIGTTNCYIGTTSTAVLTLIDDVTLHFDKNISSVAASRNNPNVVYYSTGTFGSSNSMDLDGIFKGTRSMGSWSVSDISGGLRMSWDNSNILEAPITDIAVDPNDENRIWVSFGGYEGGHKVYFTNNGGTTWQNLTSNCLPNLPVLAIVFQEMSNDRIYIGTDNGIYYRDNIQTDWAYYGMNGPQCIVNDLEINQCAGKLVAATFGRGLWEAPLLIGPENTTTVGVINWNTTRTLASDLRIVTGCTLNINNTTINIGQGVKIMIEPGAKLQITNSTLTNGCGYVWDGIKVWGHSNLIQNGTNQGTLIIDNSTIEHAIEAIVVMKPGDITTTGGIVQAKNSNFLNNKRSVAYSQYLTSINQGYFYNCIFKTDANYRHASSLLSHVSMWAIDGLRLWGCTFETNNTWPFDENRVQGITAIDANFTVNAYCTGISLPCQTPEIRCKFKGLNKAINTSRTTGTYTFSALESDFENNVFGIITTAHNNFNIRDCTFRVGKTDAAGAPSTHEGVVIMSGTGFNVDQNTFRPTFTSMAPNTIGVRANETGPEINYIYKNTFLKNSYANPNVFYGNLANGLNRDMSNARNGLKYVCNTNLNNKTNGYDFAVTDQGISAAQGGLNSPARNIFSLGTQMSGAPVGSDFNNGATTGAITYFYKSTGQEEPINIFAVSKFLTSSDENTCPILYDSGGNDPEDPRSSDPLDEYFQLTEQYPIIQQNFNEVVAELNNLLDGGNGSELLSQIQNLETGTKNALLQQLMESAPFISLEVMEALFTKIDNPLTIDEFKEISFMNPDIFRYNVFSEDCVESGIFSEEEMDSLFSQITERTLLENEIDDLYSTIFSVCNKAISIIADYPELFSSHEIVAWLFNKNSPYSEMEIVDHFIDQLNFAEARLILYNIANKYQLSLEEIEELDYFIQVKELQIAMKLENQSIKQLTPEAIAILEPIAVYSKGLGGDQARSILNQNGYDYFVPPVFPESENGEEQDVLEEVRSIPLKAWESAETAGNLLTATPNPASTEMHFSYKLQNSMPGFIFLRDHSGNVVAKLEVKDSSGSVRWNCENLTPGAYFYTLENEDQLLIEPKRVLIIR